MKIVLSRKGFDQGSGGAPSPVFEDGNMFSIPIPDARTAQRYGAMRCGERDIGEVVSHLTNGRYSGRSSAHVDPDLDRARIDRLEGWLPAFGQTGASQRHLSNQGVGPGDLFLFFGWFCDVSKGTDGRWRKTPGGRDVHAIHGWLQIGEVVDLSSGKTDAWKHVPWLCNHPHVNRGIEPCNTAYIATRSLSLPGIEDVGIEGGGRIGELRCENTLTAAGQPRKSVWTLPSWFGPSSGRTLSYHNDPRRWDEDGEAARLRSVGRGQEFVIDAGNNLEAVQWVLDVLGARPN